MRKIISIALVMVMALTLLAGCSSKEETTTAAPTTAAPTTAAPTTAAPTEAEPTPVESVEKTKVYVSPRWVQSVIKGEQPESQDYVIVECSWGEVADDSPYAQAHIPGAVHMNTDYIEEEVYWNIRTPEEIEAVMLKYGITKDTTVIVYGSNGVDSADDRFAFVCLWAGVENVKALDGGFEAWTKAGMETESGIVEPTAVEAFGATVPVNPDYVYSIDTVADKLENDDNFKLVSIRSWDEFTGVTSGYGYIDRAGEPKGAVWGKDTDGSVYNTEEGTVIDTDVMGTYLEEAGVSMADNDIAFYCGTGWRATMPFLIMYEEGYTNIHLYDGGWFQWQMDDELPVQVGDPASDDCVYTTVGELSTDKAKK